MATPGAKSDLTAPIACDKARVLEIGCRCLARAAASGLNPAASAVSCWRDLAMCYHARARQKQDNDELVKKAFAAARKCVALDTKSAEAWNLLGFLAVSWDR